MNFTTEKENIKNNRNGTNDFPLHLGWHKSKNTRGYKEFHKIGDSYYSAFKRYENKRGGYTMCCTNYRSQQCTWTGGMVNNVYSKTDEQYWDEGWEMKKARGTHTCIPIPKNDIAKLEFRNFIRKEMAEGISEYSHIKQNSKIDEKYAQYVGNLIGDERSYTRQVSETIAKKYGGRTDEIPAQYKTLLVDSAISTKIFYKIKPLK